MSSFDLRGQRVNQQFIAGGDINIGTIQSRTDLILELERLRAELARAAAGGLLAEKDAATADRRLSDAIQEAREPRPGKGAMLRHLEGCLESIKTVVALNDFGAMLGAAAERVRDLF